MTCNKVEELTEDGENLSDIQKDELVGICFTNMGGGKSIQSFSQKIGRKKSIRRHRSRWEDNLILKHPEALFQTTFNSMFCIWQINVSVIFTHIIESALAVGLQMYVGIKWNVCW
jgi:hypothetical protein